MTTARELGSRGKWGAAFQWIQSFTSTNEKVINICCTMQLLLIKLYCTYLIYMWRNLGKEKNKSKCPIGYDLFNEPKKVHHKFGMVSKKE